MTRNRTPLREYGLTQKVNAGIAIASEHGEVPDYEAREAMIYCNYNMLEWMQIDWTERARAVAQYRTHSLIEAHVSDAIDKAPKRRGSSGD